MSAYGRASTAKNKVGAAAQSISTATQAKAMPAFCLTYSRIAMLPM